MVSFSHDVKHWKSLYGVCAEMYVMMSVVLFEHRSHPPRGRRHLNPNRGLSRYGDVFPLAEMLFIISKCPNENKAHRIPAT